MKIKNNIVFFFNKRASWWKWKSWLKAQHSENEDHGIWSHHFMTNRWGNSGNSGWLYFGGSRITADGDCSHEIKRRLPLGRKVMTNLDSILESRDVTLPTKVCLVGHDWATELNWTELNWSLIYFGYFNLDGVQ